MSRAGNAVRTLIVLAGLLCAACAPATGEVDSRRVVASPAATARPTPKATPTQAPAVLATPAPTPVAAAATVAPTPPRVVTTQRWTPFAAAGPITLRHPSSRVERVAFHQSNHEGAQQLRPLRTAVAPKTLETRDRLTGARTAADVVLHPNVEVRAPVTGRVKRAGSYVLYCDNTDHYVVIAPDDRPEWEVKVLHIEGLSVSTGQRVVAGRTVLSPRPRRLPFESQVDETTADPPWPHVHIEVVDPSIPNKPSPGSGC